MDEITESEIIGYCRDHGSASATQVSLHFADRAHGQAKERAGLLMQRLLALGVLELTEHFHLAAAEPKATQS